MWIVFSFITAFSETAKDVVGKMTSKKGSEYSSAFALNFISSLFLFPIALYFGIPEIKWYYWISLLVALIARPVWSILYMRAIKLSPLSQIIPLLALTPVITAFLAVFFDRQFPTVLGWTGIFMVVSGLYLSRLESFKKESVLKPITNIFHDPGSRAMLGVALIWSLGGHITKVGVSGSSPFFSAFLNAFLGSIVIYFIAKRKGANPLSDFKNDSKRLTSLGFFEAISSLSMRLALLDGMPAYVGSIKRTNIFWSSLAGKVIFHEDFSGNKVVGVFIMIAGIITILIGG